MTGLNPPDDLPAMAVILPEVTAQIAAVLHQMGYRDLAETLPCQRFYGRCPCKPGCTFALTAPQGSSGTGMVWLEIDGQTIGQASVSPDRRAITDVELTDPQTLGIPTTWLDQAIASSTKDH